MEKLLIVNDLCVLLQGKKGLVYKWVHYGYVPHIKIGNVLRFKES
ncbi:MAG: DNA-binding protein [Candidatus Omnitrophota bacterium]